MRLHPNPRVDHGWSFQIIFAIWRILLDYYLQNHHFYGCYKPSPNFGRPHPKLPNFCRAARDFQVRTNIDHIWASVDIGPYGPIWAHGADPLGKHTLAKSWKTVFFHECKVWLPHGRLKASLGHTELNRPSLSVDIWMSGCLKEKPIRLNQTWSWNDWMTACRFLG